MPDLIDDVQESVEKFNETALKAQLEKVKPQKPYIEDEGDVECSECGVVIPVGRRKNGYDLCVDCKKELDRIEKIKRNRGEAY